MNKDPAIERMIAVNELTEILCGKPCDICKFYGQRSKCMPVYTAEKIVDAGWRKASEVAREFIDWLQANEHINKSEEYRRELCEMFLSARGSEVT